MPEYTGTVETTLSQEEAFAYMAEFSHTSEWDPNCESAERTSTGEVGRGTRFHLVFSGVAGQKLELDYEITEFDPPRRVVLEADTGSLHSTDTIEVSAAGAGTEVSYTADIELKGIKQLAAPILAMGLSKAGSDARKGLEEKLNP